MLKKVLLGLVAVVVVLLVVVATRPDTYHVERSVVVATTPDVVFPQVNELHRFATWSPWEKRDPNMKKTYEGTDGTVGASQSWVGNDEVGTGKMTITETVANQKVVEKLEFVEPMASTATVTLSLVSSGPGTKVTWAMDGNNNFVGKFFCLFMDMDKMVGGDFDQGLAQLKTVSEAEAKKLADSAAEAQAKAAAEAQAAADAAAKAPKGKK